MAESLALHLVVEKNEKKKKEQEQKFRTSTHAFLDVSLVVAW